MTKMTYAMAIDNAIALFSQGGQIDAEDRETVEKLEALKAQLAKRNSGERKPTKIQMENDAFKAAIVEYLTAVDTPKNIKEMQSELDVIADLSNQRMTHMLTDLVKTNVLNKDYVKRVPYFSIVA